MPWSQRAANAMWLRPRGASDRYLGGPTPVKPKGQAGWASSGCEEFLLSPSQMIASQPTHKPVLSAVEICTAWSATGVTWIAVAGAI